jgi:hypothetical protein
MRGRQLSAKPGEDPQAPRPFRPPRGRRERAPREGLHTALKAFAFVPGAAGDISFTI